MKNQKFYGRTTQLKLLDTYFEQRKSNFITLYGRRRVGKSFLIEKFSNNKTFYKFVGLTPDQGITGQDQRNSFAKQLSEYGLPEIQTEDWMDLFKLLALKVENSQAVILFDEISWMAQGDPTFLPKLKSAWDNLFKHKSQVLLIVCGSVSSWIEKNILNNTGFVGRVDHVMKLGPLSIQECNGFFEGRSLSAYEKFKVLSITGGIPLYIDAFNFKDPFEQNIKRLCFTSGGLLLREFQVIFHDLFDKRAATYKNIVEALVTGPQDTKSIAKSIQWDPSGVLTDYLRDLETAGFISRDYIWHFKTAKLSKLSRYRLSDNYLRFYLRCLVKLKPQIESQHFDETASFDIPGWQSILGLQFENLVLQNRTEIWKALNLAVPDIIFDNPYFQHKNTKQLGCQIDYLIQTKFNTIFVCEVKFTTKKIGPEIIKEMQEKIKRLNMPKNFSCFPVLICIGEVSESVISSEFFTKIIQFEDIL